MSDDVNNDIFITPSKCINKATAKEGFFIKLGGHITNHDGDGNSTFYEDGYVIITSVLSDIKWERVDDLTFKMSAVMRPKIKILDIKEFDEEWEIVKD